MILSLRNKLFFQFSLLLCNDAGDDDTQSVKFLSILWFEAKNGGMCRWQRHQYLFFFTAANDPDNKIKNDTVYFQKSIIICEYSWG
jgi:hypothetical protein